MKSSGVLNPEILNAVATLGHTQLLAIVDTGLPVPKGVTVIDVSVSAGVPGFLDVLCAVGQELVIDSYIYAHEIKTCNKPVYEGICAQLEGVQSSGVTHKEFKQLIDQAFTVIRTGECSKYANIILVGGTNF